MEESGAMVAKRVWSMVRALYFMLRKDKSNNKKMMLGMKMMMKRGKVARKAFQNLMLHHQAKDTIAYSSNQYLSSNVLPGEYIFSCSSDAPLSRLKTRNASTGHRFFFSCAHAPPTMEDGDELSVNIIAALEMLQTDIEVVSSVHHEGSRRSPLVRITEDEDRCVDEAAEEFIQKFYKDLKNQT